MLRHHITHFLDYCKNSNFSNRSIESLECRLLEFNAFIQQQAAPGIEHITYHHLIQFVADFGTPSPSVKKMRVWSLHQFFHYLTLQQLIPHNVAALLQSLSVLMNASHD
ncbi:MAG: site-specific integrase [Candidatus Zhuqueibacterota bacterium]